MNKYNMIKILDDYFTKRKEKNVDYANSDQMNWHMTRAK